MFQGKDHMNAFRLAKTVCAAGLVAACAWGIVGCSDNQASTSTTGGVAATVNGTEIAEDTITNYVDHIRMQMGASEEDAWGEWLAANNYTPETVREQVIDTFVLRELISKEAEARGIKVESSEVDEALQQTKSQFVTDEKWQATLEAVNTTEEEYRSEIEMQLLAQHLQESFASNEEPSEEDMLQYAEMYASAYDGARRSSHILFEAGDEATAQEVLDKINSGELDFVEAVKQYSKDTVSAEQDGDIGWDVMSSLDPDYSAGLKELEKDQVSGLVTSSFGIHIIKCTDVFVAPKGTAEDGTEKVEITSVDQVPAEWLDSIKQSLTSMKTSEAYQAWVTEAKEAAEIVINPMPEGLPYYVDMTKYQSADSDGNASSDGSAEGSGTTTNEDGSTTTTKSDGTVVTVNVDGSINATHADGTRTEVSTDRVVRVYGADGQMTKEATGEEAEQLIAALMEGVDTSSGQYDASESGEPGTADNGAAANGQPAEAA